MDEHYHPLYQQARDLQYKFHDVLDQPHHPMADSLRREIHELVEDIEKQKNPRSIETRIKTIQHQLLENRMQPHPVVSYDHINYLHHNYEQMRNNVRRFPHY